MICLNILQTVASGKKNFHKHYKSKIEIIQWSFVYIQNRSKCPIQQTIGGTKEEQTR